jgi:hypothetical protein
MMKSPYHWTPEMENSDRSNIGISSKRQCAWSAGLCVLACTVLASIACGQQVNIPRIEQMPAIPSPYQMRDWKEVTLAYDSLVLNTSLTGEYLPLTSLYGNTVNYPAHGSFYIHTVVGTTAPHSTEAINALPAVVGASLAGVDKNNQNGNNWVLMCEEWFNRSGNLNVYANGPTSNIIDDWWYETMPNVFFYQLYSLYPGTGSFDEQFMSVADQWLKAVRTMGGSATPWHVPDMNHRGWNLLTMTPTELQSFPEPEAGGAIAWLLYNAYAKTGNVKYREGAEWAMEFLDAYPTNPSYELQLPYGTYLAARMNAEIGTTYDVEKMLNWCFSDGVNTIRSWGVMAGTWGGYDCSGLVGEITDRQYAFSMNTFEQIGALVPLVRYDPRFARAIGKWVLNAANASRLFYPAFLPDANQDTSSRWSHAHDPGSTIAHEAMLKSAPLGPSPYATGDAIAGGWGATTLTLYSSSHVGILGAIIDTTDVPMILKLNLLKTDYFHEPAYPSFLFYNPYATAKSVTMDVGPGSSDLYDAVSKTFLQTGVSGQTSLSIPADGAVLVVVVPAGGSPVYALDVMSVNGVVVDFHSGNPVGNYPPRIKGEAADSASVIPGDSTQVYCTATDRDGDQLSYAWSASAGMIDGTGPAVLWVAPSTPDTAVVTCIVTDGRGGSDSSSTRIFVAERTVLPPVITRIFARPGKVDLGTTTIVTCLATDPQRLPLTYEWSSSYGTSAPDDSTASWTAPNVAGDYAVRCRVSNGSGGASEDSVLIEVRDFTNIQSGTLLAYYPFNGNANDATGNGHDGVVSGATPTTDRFSYLNHAYYFDGNTNKIQVMNDPNLNFQSGITVSFWMKASTLYADRESYPISHGNWQNRWKISITPTKQLRWTIKTAATTRDLDSKTILAPNTDYQVTTLYDGSDMEIYLNGELDNFVPLSGLILQTNIDLTIGQALPTDPNYNFNGVLDDIRLYDYGLSFPAVQQLYEETAGVGTRPQAEAPASYALYQNYPNPFNPATTISFAIPHNALTTVRIYNTLGQVLATLVNQALPPGSYTIPWNASQCASGVYYVRMQSGNYSQVRPMVLLK